MANPQGGAFLTSRELFGNPIWKNIVEFRLFFLIYGNAVFSEEGVRVADDLVLKRGQWLRSTRKLQEDLEYIENRQVKQYSTSTINRAIKSLSHVKVLRLCTKTHELGTVFTVVNYELYQGFGYYKQAELGTQLGTVTEQSRNNNNNVINDINVKDLKRYSPVTPKLIEMEDETVPKDNSSIAKEVIDYLNAKTDSSYKPKTKSIVEMINGRLSEGYNIADFMYVIDIKVGEWGNDPKMAKYLRPSTLFRPTNFAEYRNQKMPLTTVPALSKENERLVRMIREEKANEEVGAHPDHGGHPQQLQ